MARDALEHGFDADGQPVFENVTRLPDGSVDREKLGGEPYVERGGQLVDPYPSVPDRDGRPVRPTKKEVMRDV